MDFEQVTGLVRAVIVGLDGRLPSGDIESAWSLADAGEPGVALELICTQAYEYDVSVPLVVFRQIVEAGKAMGLDAGLWEELAVEQ